MDIHSAVDVDYSVHLYSQTGICVSLILVVVLIVCKVVFPFERYNMICFNLLGSCALLFYLISSVAVVLSIMCTFCHGLSDFESVSNPPPK